jgi:menaquinone-dependent protoporphyrinogen oxidase
LGSHILILYSTIDGHTREICERLQQVVERQGHQATLVSLEDTPAFDLEPFDRIVIGASIRYGKHRRQVIDFINANVRHLQSKPSAFFSVNVVARKPGKNTPDTNPYVRKILKQISWRPRQLAVFAGKIDYPRYGFWDRAIIRFIMWMTRDWQQVEAFGALISAM